MKIKEEVIIEPKLINTGHDLYGCNYLTLIFDKNLMFLIWIKKKVVDEKVKKEFNKVGQYFFDQGRKYGAGEKQMP